MGRPLNKKFFGDGAGLLAVECWTERAGASTAGYIVRQRSNLVYEIADETLTDVDVDNLTVGSLYEIAVVGTTDFTTAGAASNTVGVRFTATAALATGTGTAREIVFGKLQEAAVTAAGQARLPVVPENAQTPAEMQVDFGTTGGVVDSVTLVDGGYGYWADGTFNITVASDGGYVAGTEAVINYQVANGSVISVGITSGGTGYTADLPNTTDVNTADLPNQAANPPTQYARILSARQVKCFPAVGGNTYAWPTTAPLGGFRGPFSEAAPNTQ